MILSILIYLVVFLAFFFLIYILVQRSSEESARRALGIETKSKVVKSPMIRLFRPAFSLFLPIARSVLTDEQRRKRRKQFILANMADELTPEEFLAYRLLLLSIALIFSLLYGAPPIILVLFVSLAFFFPVKWLHDRIKLRNDSIVRELPHIVDILALSTRAGLGFIAGIKRLTENRKPSPLMEELTMFLQEIQMGSSRQDAFRNMAARCNAQEMNQFIIVLIQASNLGVPISQVLRAQSEKMRNDRFQKAERIGTAATQKIIFPLVFLIMPAVMIVVLGPLVISFLMR